MHSPTGSCAAFSNAQFADCVCACVFVARMFNDLRLLLAPQLCRLSARAHVRPNSCTDSGSDEMGAGSITMMFSDSYVELNGSIMSAHIVENKMIYICLILSFKWVVHTKNFTDDCNE